MINGTNLSFVEVLGEGGQGTVCKYRDSTDGKEWAVKLEPQNAMGQSLLTECLFLKKNKNGDYKRLPLFKEHGYHNMRRFLAMELLP